MIKFIAADLDGTLLDSSHDLPAGFFDLVKLMSQNDITFAAASGRQYYGVEKVFEPVKDNMVFIAENGGIAFEKGRQIYSDPMPDEDVLEMTRAAEELAENGVRVLLSGEKSSYVTSADGEFANACKIYCARLDTVRGFGNIPNGDRIIKIAIHDKNAENFTYPIMKKFADRYNVMLSGSSWVDIVNMNVNKGAAVTEIMKSKGIGFDEAMVFGDYLNDYEMMSCCKYSFAMANAHPKLKEAANFTAGSNDENGVVREILKYCPELQKIFNGR